MLTSALAYNNDKTTTPRTVTVLGATGSIGLNTLDMVRHHPGRYRVVAVTANRRVAELAHLAREFEVQFAAIADPVLYQDLADALAGSGIRVGAGAAAICEAANMDADFVMAGIVGAAGLPPTVAAMERGVTVGLANKECLVCAGEAVMRLVQKSGATLLPVDSEHNAIFQVFDYEQPETVSRIVLTASGGPFLHHSLDHMRDVGPAEAVAHPNWDMGAKISVDSATLMNKGLEMIEAYHLFPVAPEQVDAIIHPQSVVHSMVEYVDGSVLAQMGSPDMRTPIAYAMAWPERISTPSPKLDLTQIGSLTFSEPDVDRFPCLGLAQQALRTGTGATAVLNAANEVAVDAFLTERVGFLEIAAIVEDTLDRMNPAHIDSVDHALTLDHQARRIAGEILEARAR